MCAYFFASMLCPATGQSGAYRSILTDHRFEPHAADSMTTTALFSLQIQALCANGY